MKITVEYYGIKHELTLPDDILWTEIQEEMLTIYRGLGYVIPYDLEGE